MRYILAIWFTCVMGSTGFARIVEIKTMSEILPEIDDKTLVIFDLDNTVVEAKQMLGSDAWFEYLLAKFTAENAQKKMPAAEAKRSAIAKAIGGWMPYQKITDVGLVESGTLDLIHGLQKRGLTTMGLTARSIDLTEASSRQLKSVGIDFFQGGWLPRKALGLKKGQAAWHAGVLFVGPGQDKGVMLKQFLKANGIAHHKIVFVDDKQRNVEAVDRAFSGTTTPCVAFRYGATDEKVSHFNPRIAEFQRDHFGKILSDEMASQLMGSQNNRGL